MPRPLSSRTVGAHELRRRFNNGRYWQRAQAGELRQILLKDTHPSPPRAAEPLCTRSQAIAYHDAQGHRVAVVHQYMMSSAV